MGWSKKVKYASIVLFWVCIAVHGPAHAQSEGASSSDQVWTDEAWEEAARNKNLDEQIQKPKEDHKPKENSEVKEKVEVKEREISTDFTDTLWFKFLGICIIAILVVLIVYFIVTSNKGVSNSALKNVVAVLPDQLEVLPEEPELDRFMRLAIDQKDFKSAVRIHYLKLLQQLQQKGWLVWMKDKTNRDYLRELRTRSAFGTIREVTWIYELIWYGDASVDETTFYQIQNTCIKLSQELSKDEK